MTVFKSFYNIIVWIIVLLYGLFHLLSCWNMFSYDSLIITSNAVYTLLSSSISLHLSIHIAIYFHLIMVIIYTLIEVDDDIFIVCLTSTIVFVFFKVIRIQIWGMVGCITNCWVLAVGIWGLWSSMGMRGIFLVVFL